ncbi:unnamed protein product [Heligmosomoides polygyrus]|uniref:Potassium channel tetramerisation-type BTB domain-containing protein n=1 Tax=Heligmosomoides polygyrus TaxID=6339 RepID=A0A183FDE3_HELPZ|nr:unnamed protein product [Heligmosomoides polygyrus]
MTHSQELEQKVFYGRNGKRLNVKRTESISPKAHHWPTGLQKNLHLFAELGGDDDDDDDVGVALPLDREPTVFVRLLQRFETTIASASTPRRSLLTHLEDMDIAARGYGAVGRRLPNEWVELVVDSPAS